MNYSTSVNMYCLNDSTTCCHVFCHNVLIAENSSVEEMSGAKFVVLLDSILIM